MNEQNRDLPQALITGGGGDLAHAITEKLKSQGFEVLCPNKSHLDVTNKESVESFFHSQVTTKLELLINNAGLKEDSPMLNMSKDSWDRVMDVNLKGSFTCSKFALKFFLKNRYGHIINMGSYSALSGPSGQTNYAASKAGLIGMTKSLAAETGKRNVRVNCVLPGWIETKFTANVNEVVKNKALNEHVLNRFNDKKSVAEFIYFLHRQMENVSGQVFQLDSRVGRWI